MYSTDSRACTCRGTQNALIHIFNIDLCNIYLSLNICNTVIAKHFDIDD